MISLGKERASLFHCISECQFSLSYPHDRVKDLRILSRKRHWRSFGLILHFPNEVEDLGIRSEMSCHVTCSEFNGRAKTGPQVSRLSA